MCSPADGARAAAARGGAAAVEAGRCRCWGSRGGGVLLWGVWARRLGVLRAGRMCSPDDGARAAAARGSAATVKARPLPVLGGTWGGVFSVGGVGRGGDCRLSGRDVFADGWGAGDGRGATAADAGVRRVAYAPELKNGNCGLWQPWYTRASGGAPQVQHARPTGITGRAGSGNQSRDTNSLETSSINRVDWPLLIGHRQSREPIGRHRRPPWGIEGA